MILEFEKIGKIEVKDLTCDKHVTEYIFSERDKCAVELVMMEDLIYVSLVLVDREWLLVMERSRCSPFVEDFFVFKAISNGHPCIFDTYL